MDCPPSYAEVIETPPPYYLLPKSFQRSSSRLRKEYQLENQLPKPSPNATARTSFKKFVFRSKSLMTNGSSYYSTFEASPSLVTSSLRFASDEGRKEDGSNPQEKDFQNEEISSSSSSRKSSADSLSSLTYSASRRRSSLGLRNTLSCPLNPSSFLSQKT